MIGLTKTLAKEWGQFNIQVNAVAFGRIETRLTQAKERGETITREGVEIAIGIPGERLERTTPMIPMGRAGTATEAAGAIFFFASPFSDYVSGQVLKSPVGCKQISNFKFEMDVKTLLSARPFFEMIINHQWKHKTQTQFER